MGEVIQLHQAIKHPTDEYLSGAKLRHMCVTGKWKAVCRELELYDVLNIVNQITGVTLTQMRKRTRVKKFVDARHLFVLMARGHTKHSYMSIGRCLDRDHTTVISLENREVHDGLQKEIQQAEKKIDTFKDRVFGPPVS